MTATIIPFPIKPNPPAPDHRGGEAPDARLHAMLDWPPERVPAHLRAHVEALRVPKAATR